jgi:2-amino-4-hydroxy-6-hydroxymethyldihydropteridine diphosphokinase
MIIIALGSNLNGVWGTPRQALRRALDELERSGVHILAASNAYRTISYGMSARSVFVNAVAIAATVKPAPALIRIFKQIEALAGRRTEARRWRARPLDLDIVDYKGLVCNWNLCRPLAGKRVILPHAGAHERAFVLRPILDVVPAWHHPVFGATAAELLKRPKVRAAGAVIEDDGPLL